TSRDQESPVVEVRPGAQTTDDGEQVGDALAEQGLAQDQRRPGIMLLVVVLAGVSCGAAAELRRRVALAAQVGRAGRASLLGEPAAERALRRRAAAGRLEHDDQRPIRIALLRQEQPGGYPDLRGRGKLEGLDPHVAEGRGGERRRAPLGAWSLDAQEGGQVDG